MYIPTEPALTIGDCIELLDRIDSCLTIVNSSIRQSSSDVQIRSMLAVIRREIANRVLDIHRLSISKGKFSAKGNEDGLRYG
jgi:hypothetical protein